MDRARATSGPSLIIAFMILTAFFVLPRSMAFADMVVTTQDGRTYSVPVQATDVKSIEFSGSGSYSSLGCFRDQGDPTGTSGRDLYGFVANEPGMTTERCVSLCRGKGFQYAGTQYSTWCFCGNSYGRSGPADNCNMKCSGNKSQTCGGSWANSVYSVR